MDQAGSPLHVLESPATDEACEEIRKALAYKNALLIIGSFSMKENGGNSYPQGERILIIKSDWSLVVHRDSMFSQPMMNWEKCDNIRSTCDDHVLLLVEREEERNDASDLGQTRLLEIDFSRIYLIVEMNLMDDTLFAEKGDGELLVAVMLKPELLELGFVPHSTSQELRSGFVSVVGADSRGRKTVALLTKSEAGTRHVSELTRFIASVRGHVKKEDIRGIIGAPSISRAGAERAKEFGYDFKKIDLTAVEKILALYKQGLGNPANTTQGGNPY
ncbi:MAG: endonuclease NucS domain-containing protein [Thermoprotei archaeon]|nr:endonuclease NucS [TACK group archaeon]